MLETLIAAVRLVPLILYALMGGADYGDVLNQKCYRCSDCAPGTANCEL